MHAFVYVPNLELGTYVLHAQDMSRLSTSNGCIAKANGWGWSPWVIHWWLGSYKSIFRLSISQFIYLLMLILVLAYVITFCTLQLLLGCEYTTWRILESKLVVVTPEMLAKCSNKASVHTFGCTVCLMGSISFLLSTRSVLHYKGVSY